MKQSYTFYDSKHKVLGSDTQFFTGMQQFPDSAYCRYYESGNFKRVININLNLQPK